MFGPLVDRRRARRRSRASGPLPPASRSSRTGVKERRERDPGPCDQLAETHPRAGLREHVEDEMGCPS